MNSRVIRALLKKDFALFMSNRFYMLITFLGLIFYVGIYFILPSAVDEKIGLALYAPVVPPVFTQLTGEDSISIEYFPDAELLKQSVLNGDYDVALSLPDNIMDTGQTGEKPEITVYYSSSTTPELKDAIVALVKELSYAQTGQSLNYDTTEEILGPDNLGSQITLRDRLRPLLAIFILLVEILSLAGLISIEIEQGTARALFTTPMRISDLFVAKGIIGVGLAFIQSILFMQIVGGFSDKPEIIIITLFIGSLMVTGISFLLASLARDIMAVTGWGMLILVIFAIPGFGTVVPGLLSDWAKVIPSYYLTDTMNRIVNYGAGWPDVGMNLVILTIFTIVVVCGGMVTLRRRYR